MHDRVLVCKLTDYVVDGMPSLVTHELDWTSVTAPKMFVYEFGRGCCRVIAEGFRLDPFRAVVRGHYDVPIPCSGRGWLEWLHLKHVTLAELLVSALSGAGSCGS